MANIFKIAFFQKEADIWRKDILIWGIEER
jgi:hypothetical protein